MFRHCRCSSTNNEAVVRLRIGQSKPWFPNGRTPVLLGYSAPNYAKLNGRKSYMGPGAACKAYSLAAVRAPANTYRVSPEMGFCPYAKGNCKSSTVDWLAHFLHKVILNPLESPGEPPYFVSYVCNWLAFQ